jgi:hypothetical protein
MGGEAECPADEDEEPVLEADEVPEVDDEPGDPSDEAAEFQPLDVGDCGCSSDRGEVAFVSVAELRSGARAQPSLHDLRGVAALLHGDRRHPGEHLGRNAQNERRWTRYLGIKEAERTKMRAWLQRRGQAADHEFASMNSDDPLRSPPLVCVECGHVQTADERGWRSLLTVDDADDPEPVEAVVYCPSCAEREFGSPSSR